MALQHQELQLQLAPGPAQFSPEGGAAALHKHPAMLHAFGAGGARALPGAASSPMLRFKAQPAGSVQPSIRQTAKRSCIEASHMLAHAHMPPCPKQQETKELSCPRLTKAFLFGLPSAVTETERATGLAVEALLGRRETGAGRPVRLRSTPPEPAPWKEELLRVLFMLEQNKGVLRLCCASRSEGTESTSSLVWQRNNVLCS